MNEDYISTRDELAYSIWSEIMKVNGYERPIQDVVKDTLYVLQLLFDQPKPKPARDGDIIRLK